MEQKVCFGLTIVEGGGMHQSREAKQQEVIAGRGRVMSSATNMKQRE